MLLISTYGTRFFTKIHQFDIPAILTGMLLKILANFFFKFYLIYQHQLRINSRCSRGWTILLNFIILQYLYYPPIFFLKFPYIDLSSVNTACSFFESSHGLWLVNKLVLRYTFTNFWFQLCLGAIKKIIICQFCFNLTPMSWI